MNPLAIVFTLYYFCGVPLFLYYSHVNLEELDSQLMIVHDEEEEIDGTWNVV